jgi:arginine utilization regulatory protein
LPNELLDYLVSLEWRGNFRELRNALEYAIIMNDNGILNKGDFPGKVAILAKSEDDFLELFPENFNESIEIFEKMYLKNIILKNAGKVNDTARRLGISKTTLIYKSKKYKINSLKIRAEASDLAA